MKAHAQFPLVLRLFVSVLFMIATANATETNLVSFSFNTTNAVPDGNPSGFADRRQISGLEGQIADVRITLNLHDGFNGDLYAYVTHGNSLVVLLNRAGVSSSDPAGYSDSGMSITLSDSATADVHWYQNFNPTFNSEGQLTGQWQPDGRNVDPDFVNEFSVRNTGLNMFNGADPNGEWTLFLADLYGGGKSTLTGWRLDVSVVPEPQPFTLFLLGFAIFALAQRQRRACRR